MSQSTSTPVAFGTADLRSQTSREGSDAKLDYGLVLTGIVIAGVLLRIVVTILAGNGMRTPWGGGGDTHAYVLLAQNVLFGKGYAYAGMPTALRAPGYPLLLVAFFKLFGSYALAAMRWLQFFEGIGVALLCAATAGKLFGERAKKITLATALLFPTLVEMNGEILSEAPATLCAAFFFYLLVSYLQEPRSSLILGLAGSIGLGALFRFNFAALGIVAVAVLYLQSSGRAKWLRIATLAILSLAVISPWLIRNWIVFHGEALFSTHSGLEALEGVLTPQGRALPGDSSALRAAVGWVPPVDVETNARSRLELGTEPGLDRQCWRAAIAIAGAKGWGLLPLAIRKIADFWLSTDQLFWTGAFPLSTRIARAAGVLTYWLLLAMAIVGWFRLRLQNAEMARLFLICGIVLTALHLPFVMNTRLRMPFVEPMVAMLAGGGLAILLYGISGQNRPKLMANSGS